MVETNILHAQEPQLNASLIIALISPVLLQDYKLLEEGLYCYFTQPISHCQVVIKTFLAALYEITNKQFYFEIVKEQEAILKIYGKEQLQFSKDVLFRSSISSQGRRKV